MQPTCLFTASSSIKFRRGILGSVLSLVVLATAPADASVLAYYPFDTDFNDVSGNGNHLRKPAAGVAISTALGEVKLGAGALDLDSTVANEVHLDLQDPISFAAGDPWSVIFWARRRPGTDARTGMILGSLGASDFIWIPDNPDTVEGLRFRSSSGADADYAGISDDNQYHHWAVIADGAGNVSVYRDNVALGETASDSSFQITSVGQAFNQATQSMDGQIDELYVYSGAVDGTVVEALFLGNEPPAPAGTSILAYYPFDADFTDASANNNHLTSTAAPPESSPSISATAGQFGVGAADFESSISTQAYLNLSMPLSFGAADPWSVAFWARHRPGTDGRTGMIAGDLTNTDFIWIPKAGAVNTLRFRNSSGGNADYNDILDDDEYHHWAVVADGAGNVSVYRDSESIGSRSLATNFDITSIGQAFNQTTQSMDGQIDELYIYDEAIDAATVEALFAGAAGADFAITEVGVAGGVITLTWNSVEGASYVVRYSTDLLDWSGDLNDSVVGDAGSQTTRSFDINPLELGSSAKIFVRVERGG